MANLVNHSVTNLINGVSEQAPAVRLDNQVEEQINCFSDVTKGLIKRNGVELKKVTLLDVKNTFKIPFNIDGIRHMIALDTTNVGSEVKYVPLSTDVDALATSINSPEYFNEMSRGDLQILEDKDKVYLLNRRQIVGTANSVSTYFNIKLTRQDNNTTPTTWDTGEYTITVNGVAGTGSGNTPTGPLVITANRTTTLQDIADTINGNASIVAMTGFCTVSGTISNYRVTFGSIPEGWTFPSITVNETTAITEGYAYLEDSGWLYNLSQNSYIVGDQWFFNGQLIFVEPTSSQLSSVYLSPYTYYRGSVAERIFLTSYYAIRRTRPLSIQYNYNVSIDTPSAYQTEGEGILNSLSGMIWVTGVSSNQTYDTTVSYYDISDPLTILTATSSTSVGTTASNIKLNWVANDIGTDLATSSHITTAVHDNAVHIIMASGYAISKIETTNNFDISSINGIQEAVKGNETGIITIDTLPPLFSQGFRIRVNTSGDNKSNYYLAYDAEFKGWKEVGLDETRFLDYTTMPYVIDKNKTRENGIVLIEPSIWVGATAGDEVSNTDPSFVGRTINDLFFYSSRLGFATDDTLVMSAINEFDTFFRTTTSQTVTSDRVDIKLDSSKIGYDPIINVITYDGKLLINTGSNQSILLVNQSFDLTSARLSEVSSYSLGYNKPIPVGSGLYFANTTEGYTNVFNYSPTSNTQYEATELTKHCPKYIKGDFKSMSYSSDVAVVSTFDNARVLYIQNRYTQGGQMMQNAWHKWTLPFDIEHFYFYNNELFIIMSAVDSEDNDYTLVTRYSLKPEEVLDEAEVSSIGWRPLLDCWTHDRTLISQFPEFIGVNEDTGYEYDTTLAAYLSSEKVQIDIVDSSLEGPYAEKDGSPKYYWKIDSSLNTINWNDEEVSLMFGNNTLESFDSGDYRYYKGDLIEGETNYYEISREEIVYTDYVLDNVIYGTLFNAQVVLSKIIPRQQTQDGYVTMNYATLMLRKMRLFLGNSGLFNVTVDYKQRKDYVIKYTGKPLGQFIIGRATVSDINFNFPINAKSDLVVITIDTQGTTPFNLLSSEWQGQLITKGRSI